MNTMYDRIIARCNELGITGGYLCDSIGIRRAFLTELKCGRTKNLSCDKVFVIADFLGVSCDYIITGRDFKSELTDDERKLLSAYRIASPEEKQNVCFILRNYGAPSPEVSQKTTEAAV